VEDRLWKRIGAGQETYAYVGMVRSRDSAQVGYFKEKKRKIDRA
jgi:hypothetical protein